MRSPESLRLAGFYLLTRVCGPRSKGLKMDNKGSPSGTWRRVPATVVATVSQATRRQRCYQIDKLGKDRDDYYAELVAAAWIAEQRYTASRGETAPKPYVDKSVWNQRRMQLRALRRRREIVAPLEDAAEPTVDPWLAFHARQDIGTLARSIPARLLELLAREEVLASTRLERRDREEVREAREWARLAIPEFRAKARRGDDGRAK